jgi:hypothetical protein
MPRRINALILFGLLLAGAAAKAAVFPEWLGTAKRSDQKAIEAAPNGLEALFEEYGFDGGEQAAYGPLQAEAYRFRDSTGAMAAWQAMRPADAKPCDLEKMCAAAGDSRWVARANYLFHLTGGTITASLLAPVIAQSPKLESSPLPVISTYLPPEGLIPNSERYITGPVSLEKFSPGLSPSAVAFHLSAEGQYGRYRTKSGNEVAIAIFNYPTPGLARERADQFQKIAGAVVKRSGPLVIFAPNPAAADDAERVLAKVNYQASLTMNERPKENIAQSTAQMILSILQLAGIIIAFCLLSGLAFAGLQQLSRRLGKQDAGEAMITLHLQGK